MSRPLLSIIIVAYKSRDEIGACLRSIPRELARPGGGRGAVEVCVVDNSAAGGEGAERERARGGEREKGRTGEADDVGEIVRREFPWVDYVAAERNLGFGRANNAGYARTSGEFVLFLNPDTVVNAAALEHCVARLDADVEIGLISPKTRAGGRDDGLGVSARIPTLWDGFCRAAGLAGKWPRVRWFAGYNLTFLPENESYDVGAINGAFMLGPRWLFAEEVAEDGAVFDEQFFMYGDDLDLCIRVGMAGFRIVYDGRVAITHLKGVSVAKEFDAMARAIFDANREVYLKHFVPHGAWWAGIVKLKYRVAFGVCGERSRCCGRRCAGIGRCGRYEAEVAR
jgi:N-acetylglucosaminyl-diphospho-decaprenol L-rhamnosyltransferase